jgi:hypothetical protein
MDRVESGEEVIIEHDEGATAKIMPVVGRVNRTAIGSLADQLDLSGGWDSTETNVDISADFGVTIVAKPFVRDVAEEVAEGLNERAAPADLSLPAYVADELAWFARAPANAAGVARLRSRDRSDAPSTEDILEAVWQSRP